jgi:hypothetical protein
MLNKFLNNSSVLIGKFLCKELEEKLNKESLLRNIARRDILKENDLPIYKGIQSFVVLNDRTCVENNIDPVPFLEVAANVLVPASNWKTSFDQIFEYAFKNILSGESELAEILLQKIEDKRDQFKIIMPVRLSLTAIRAYSSDGEHGYSFFEQIGAVAVQEA